jgi:hypothetical protein
MTSTSTYIAGGESVVGQVVTRDVRNDELVARSALVAQAVAPFREMSVSVKPEHIASGVDEGSTVDVIATSSSATGTGRTWTVARRLEVIGRAKSSGGFAAGDARVMLKVPAELVLPLTSAMHTADIDIVGVPALADAGDIGDEAQPASQPAPQK